MFGPDSFRWLMITGIQLSSEPEVDYVKLLPENLFVALECCLDDSDDMVQLASAIALYSLQRPVEKVNCARELMNGE